MSKRQLVSVIMIAALCSMSSVREAEQSDDCLTKNLERRNEPYVPLLCPLLENLRGGDSVEVVVSGIYRVGPESSVLFDPNTPLCELDIQPTVWVDFADEVRTQELDRLLNKYQYAAVTLPGQLEGPGLPGPARPDLPMWMEFADRYLGLRHGHLDAYRARLVVAEVIDVWQAPRHQALSYVRHRPSIPQPPAVKSTTVPFYPPRALAVGLTGKVTFEVEVRQGAVHVVRLRTGERVLAAGAQEVIEAMIR